MLVLHVLWGENEVAAYNASADRGPVLQTDPHAQLVQPTSLKSLYDSRDRDSAKGPQWCFVQAAWRRGAPAGPRW
eukprot:483486-Lingulodinium_polyedra.AAC.1